MAFFESEKERKERIEREKFEVQIQTDMKVRMLEKEIQKIDRKAQEDYQRAESFRAAGNKDAAIDAYNDYQFSRSLRRTVNKSLRMMQQVTTMVKAGNLTNDVFSLLKVGLETSNFDPSAVQTIIAGNERLKGAFEAVGGMMDTTLDSGTEEISAEAWFAAGTQQASAPGNAAAEPGSTASLDKMKAEFEKLKKG